MMRQHPAERGEGAGAERESGEGLRGDVVWGPLVGAWGAVWAGAAGLGRLGAVEGCERRVVVGAARGGTMGPAHLPAMWGCLQAGRSCGRHLAFQPNY
jgi:hypothetical protein